MTTYYIQTEDDEEVRELSFGRVPERIQGMAKTLLDWETEERLRKAALEAQQRDRAPKKRKTKRKAA